MRQSILDAARVTKYADNLGRILANRAATAAVNRPGSKDLISLERVPLVKVDVPPIPGLRPPRDYQAEADAYATRANHHAAMRRKYQWLAAHPWATVEPDPPAPP